MADEERRLIAAAQRGEVESFNALVRLYEGRVYNLCYRMLGDADSAADAAQDAFLSAFRNLRSFRGGSFRSWLLRIATNTCYDVLRARKRRPTTSLDVDTDGEDDGSPLQIADTAESPEHEAAHRRECQAQEQAGYHEPGSLQLTLDLLRRHVRSAEDADEHADARHGQHRADEIRQRAEAHRLDADPAAVADPRRFGAAAEPVGRSEARRDVRLLRWARHSRQLVAWTASWPRAPDVPRSGIPFMPDASSASEGGSNIGADDADERLQRVSREGRIGDPRQIGERRRFLGRTARILSGPSSRAAASAITDSARRSGDRATQEPRWDSSVSLLA